MSSESPPAQAGFSAAEKKIAGENGNGGNRRQNISGQLRLRKGEEDDGDERPQYQEFRKGIAGRAGTRLLDPGVAETPLCDGGPGAVNEGAHGHDRPGHGG